MDTDRPDARTVRGAIELACRAPSVHNTQPWRWLVGERSVHLVADRARQVPVTDPDGRDLVLSCGAALHHLRAAFAALGWGTTVHRLPNPADPDHLAAVEPHRRTPSDRDVAIAAAIVRRRTDRRRFSSWPVPPEHLDALVRQAAAEGVFAVPVLDDLARYRLTRHIEAAASHQEAQPGYAAELAVWSGRDRSGEDGVPAASVPAGDPDRGGTRMRAFSAGTLPPSTADPEPVDGGELLVLATAGDDTVARLRAGEAASALLLTATDLGLATCPLSQPLEVAAVRCQVRDEILDGAAEPQLVVRVGWAPVSAPPVPQSPRRPVGRITAPLPGASPQDDPRGRESR